MNVNDLVEAFGLPRYFAEKLPAGSTIIATVQSSGNITIEVLPPGDNRSSAPADLRREAKEELAAWDVQVAIKRGPGRPRKTVSE